MRTGRLGECSAILGASQASTPAMEPEQITSSFPSLICHLMEWWSPCVPPPVLQPCAAPQPSWRLCWAGSPGDAVPPPRQTRELDNLWSCPALTVIFCEWKVNSSSFSAGGMGGGGGGGCLLRPPLFISRMCLTLVRQFPYCPFLWWGLNSYFAAFLSF